MSITERDSTRAFSEAAIACCQCGISNAGTRQFCGECGARLREPCLQCHAPQAVDVAYCGECGARLQGLLDKQRMEWQDVLTQARTLMETQRWPEAIVQLRSLTEPLDSRLQADYAAAITLRHQIESAWTEQQTRVQQLHQQALLAIDRCEFHEAQAALQQIPHVLINDTIDTARQRVKHAIEEMATLSQKVRQALADKAFEELLPTVYRLKQLRPHDHALAKLHDQLQHRHASLRAQATEASVRRAIAAFRRADYLQMSAHLHDVDEEAVPQTFATHYRQLLEAEFEMRALEDEPFVALWLASLIRRLRQRCRHDEQLSRRLVMMTQSLSGSSHHESLARHWPHSTAPRTHESTYAIPVEWWCDLPHSQLPVEDAKFLTRYPGAFTTAYGLALQGIGESVIPLNLMPRASGWFDRFSVWSSSKSAQNHKIAWGIDIGTQAIKALQVTRDVSLGTCYPSRCIMVLHERPLDETTNDSDMLAVIAAGLERLATDLPAQALPTVVSFPTTRVLGRTFALPPMKRLKLAEAIAFEARAQIPIPLENTVYDWHASSEGDEQTSPHQVMLLAARRDHVTSWLQSVPASHFRTVCVQTNGVAISNATAFLFSHRASASTRARDDSHDEPPEDDRAASPDPPAQSIAVLDLGAESSTFVVCNPHHFRFRSITWGTHRVERALMQALSLDRRQAAACAVDPGACASLVQADLALHSTRQDLLRQLQRALQSILAEGVRMDRLFVTGGGAATWGTLRTIVRGSENRAAPIAIDHDDM